MTLKRAEYYLCNVTGQRTTPNNDTEIDVEEEIEPLDAERARNLARLAPRWAQVTIRWIEEVPPEPIEDAEVESFVATVLKASGVADGTGTPEQIESLKAFARERMEAEREPAGYEIREIEAHLAPEAFGQLVLLGLEDKLPSWANVSEAIQKAQALLDEGEKT